MIRRLMVLTVAISGVTTLPVQFAVAQYVPLARFEASTTDLVGNPIDTIRPNQEFYLKVTVQDIRDSAAGIFSAYLDVSFDADLVTPLPRIEYSKTFPAAVNADFPTPGLIDQVGGTHNNIEPLGGAEFELFRLLMTSNSSLGTNLFEMDVTDNLILHPTTIMLGPLRGLLSEEIVFVPASLTVVPEATTTSMLMFVLPIACAILRKSRTS